MEEPAALPSSVVFRRRLLIPFAAIGTLLALSGQAASAPVASGRCAATPQISCSSSSVRPQEVRRSAER